MKINNNISAVITNKELLNIESNLTDSMERLSTGLKLNHSSDDPAGMAISYRMRLQIDSLDQASQNVDTATSVIQTMDGALNEVNDMLQRMNELAVQAANGTMGDDELSAIQAEIDSIREEITRISETTEFNGKTLLNGSVTAQVYTDTANLGNISRITVSDSVAYGTYTLSVEEAATQASYNTGITIDDIVGNDVTLTINGSEAVFTSDMTEDEVLETLRDAAEKGSCTITQEDDGTITITTTKYGTSAELTLSQDSQVFDSDKIPVGDASVVAVGTNPVVTLGDEFTSNATVTYDGNRVTITNSQGFKMQMLLEEGFTSESVSLNVTDIGVMDIQVGVHEGQTVSIRVPDVSSEALYLDYVDVTTVGGAVAALTYISDAMTRVNEVRSSIGAYENRLSHTTNNLDVTIEEMEEAISRLEDTDMATEMVTYSKYTILQQAATSALSQANSLPELALQILG